MRVLRLCMRDCAGSPNNLVLRCFKMSATHVTAKTICDLLMLFSGWRLVATFTSMPSAPAHAKLTLHLFHKFPVFLLKLFLGWPHEKCDLLGTCDNLADSRYPPCDHSSLGLDVVVPDFESQVSQFEAPLNSV